MGLAAREPSIVREIALMIGRRLRGAHDSVKSLRDAEALRSLAAGEGT
jgi:hypothetical protein